MRRIPMAFKITLALLPMFVGTAAAQMLLIYPLLCPPLGEARLAALWPRLAGPLVMPALATPALVVWIARRRLRGLVTALQRVAAGDLTTQLPPPPSREFEVVAQVFAAMSHALAAAMARLREVDRQRRRFFADLAHELATPASAILGLCDTLVRPDLCRALDEQGQALLLQSLGEEAQRVGELTGALSELAHLEDPELLLHRDRIDLAPLVLRVVERLNRADGARIDCAATAAPAWVDAVRIEQVLVNLLSNARRYTPCESRIAVATRPTAAPDAPGVELVVRDGGPGVPAEMLDRLGERLLRLDPSRDRRTGGHGLGLSIVREIVHRHGGRLQFVNDAAGGLRVTIWLPAAKPAGAGADSGEQPVADAVHGLDGSGAQAGVL